MIKNYIRTVRLNVQYDGSNYVGWQRQAKGTTIQAILEDALTKIAGEKITLFCAGRTDSGVHARKQIASMSLTKSKTPIHAFVDGTNTLLPPDIRVTAAVEEKIEFMAITSSKSKTYRYYFRHAKVDDVFLKTVWQTRFPFDLSNMKKSLKPLIGKHDFSCFQTHGRETKTSVRTIYRATIKKDRDDIYFLEIEGDGFLRHMVRSIMGTVMAIGNGKMQVTDMRKILVSKKRINAGPTAPGHALFLWDVKLK